MRVIAGIYKGKRLARPVEGIRPTTDRAREALFNSLGRTVVDSSWIDAFAGTGAVGLEALSRGARSVVFNDKSPHAIRLIRRNLSACRVRSGFEILQKDALTFLQQCHDRPVDFVFLDPPYEFHRYSKLLSKVADTVASPNSTLVILEVFKKTRPDFVTDCWELTRTLAVGDSRFLLLRLRERSGGD